MSALEIQQVAKRYGPLLALDSVSLEIPLGSFTCLLGPSGCGKTTLLRIVAGLESPDSGQVLLQGEDITGLPAHRRGLGMVFQSLALFPHLSVGENIAYGLKLSGASLAERRARIEELLALVRLEGLAERRITQLSGGQRQRVAIARALAGRPRLFLLDEPLSALDAKLREEMQVELRELQRRLGVTTLLVTHDQREAMTMADIIVVMDHGQIRQAGAPLAVYRAPADRFVADFLGAANLLNGEYRGRGQMSLGDALLDVRQGIDGVAEGTSVILCVRPEDVKLEPEGASGPNRLAGRVAFLRDLGHLVEATVELPRDRLRALVPAGERGQLAEGRAVTLYLPPDDCRLLVERGR